MICNGTDDISPAGEARRAAAAFPAAGAAARLRPLAGGMINTSFLCQAADGGRFVLQRINGGVFPDPEALMANQALVCAHLEEAVARRGLAGAWRVPTPLAAADGRPFFLDRGRGCWRLLPFIPGRCVSRPRDPAAARKLGRGLGLFHAMLADLTAGLAPVVPGFHRLSHYLAEYDAIAPAAAGEDRALARMRGNVARGRERFAALEKMWQAGRLRVQAIHGDPRCANFILAADGSPVALVDLDTVMRGPPVLDLADCVRSCLEAGGRGAAGLCREIVRGWRETAGAEAVRDLCFRPEALRCVLFELGLRGDRYFRVSRPGENLERAGRQFALIAVADGVFRDAAPGR